MGADEVNWLLLACHEAVADEASVLATSDLMGPLARRHGGKYDGWEAEVRPSCP